jgi:tetratricopeptide (TPR) repeat protein
MKNTVFILLISLTFNSQNTNNLFSEDISNFMLCEYFSLTNHLEESNRCYSNLKDEIQFESATLSLSLGDINLENGNFSESLNYYLDVYKYNKHDISLILLIYNLYIITDKIESAQSFLIDSYYSNSNNELLLDQLFSHFFNNGLIIESLEILADLYLIESISYSKIVNKCKLINDNFSDYKLTISILDHHSNKYDNFNFIDLKLIFYYLNNDLINLKKTFIKLQKHKKLNISNTLLYSEKLFDQNEYDKIFSLLYPYFNDNKLSIEGIQLLLKVALELNDLTFYLEVSDSLYKKYPFLPLSHEILINALMLNKNYEAASKIIIRAKNRFQNYYNFLIFEAKIEVINDNLLSAINIYNYILKQEDTLVDVKHDLALLYNKIAKYELCDDIFLELLNIDPENLIFISEFSSIITNRSISTDEELKYVLKLVKYGLAIHIGNPILLDNYGWINYKLGNFDLALQYVNQSLSIKKNQNVLNHLIEILKNNENNNNNVDFNK